MNKANKHYKSAILVKNIAGKMAKVACGTASGWGMYQPKEPKAINKK